MMSVIRCILSGARAIGVRRGGRYFENSEMRDSDLLMTVYGCGLSSRIAIAMTFGSKLTILLESRLYSPFVAPRTGL